VHDTPYNAPSDSSISWLDQRRPVDRPMSWKSPALFPVPPTTEQASADVHEALPKAELSCSSSSRSDRAGRAIDHL
jgi:hypothetical protein